MSDKTLTNGVFTAGIETLKDSSASHTNALTATIGTAFGQLATAMAAQNTTSHEAIVHNTVTKALAIAQHGQISGLDAAKIVAVSTTISRALATCPNGARQPVHILRAIWMQVTMEKHHDIVTNAIAADFAVPAGKTMPPIASRLAYATTKIDYEASPHEHGPQARLTNILAQAEVTTYNLSQELFYKAFEKFNPTAQINHLLLGVQDRVTWFERGLAGRHQPAQHVLV